MTIVPTERLASRDSLPPSPAKTHADQLDPLPGPHDFDGDNDCDLADFSIFAGDFPGSL